MKKTDGHLQLKMFFSTRAIRDLLSNYLRGKSARFFHAPSKLSPYLLSPRVVEEDVERAADAEGKVYSRADDGEAEVVPDTAVQMPALLDLLHPEPQEPGHDPQHAEPDDELRTVYGHVEETASCLLSRKSESRAIVEHPELGFPREAAEHAQAWHPTNRRKGAI